MNSKSAKYVGLVALAALLGTSVAPLAAHGVPLYGIDNLPGARPLERLALPRRVCLLFGQEGPGLSDEARSLCEGTFSIKQFGSTRSINASAAAAIAMHTWVVQHALEDDDPGQATS
jgi:tRNA G18 (ribose-2'-O)-methylase SpoU